MSEFMTIAVVTGSRADYGLLRPVMHAIQVETAFRLQVIVTGMHLSPEFGSTVNVIEDDGFTLDAKVESQVSGDTPSAVTKSVGLGVIGFSDALTRLAPDIMLVLGDRYEILAAVTAALFLRIPVAHIAGGDVTEAAYDDAIRHSITKMSHIHFATNPESARRLRQLGEESWRIHTVGSPAIDLIHTISRLERNDLERELNFKFRSRNLLVTFHPVTLAATPATEQFEHLLAALDDLGPDTGIVFTSPNADDGGHALTVMLQQFVASHPNSVSFKSLGHLRYYSLMAQIDAVVGNSSSGLYEAPSFRVPTVNIGDRQKGRLRANSVIDCGTSADAITDAIRRAFTLDCTTTKNPYGDGHAVDGIITVLKSHVPQATLLRKGFVDAEGI